MKRASVREVHACRFCAEAFARSDHLVLHMGRTHPGALDAEEQAAFEAELAHETDQLARLRVHVKAGFAALPVVLFLLFSVVMLIEIGGNLGFLIILLPGFAGFTALVYAMVLSKAEYDRIEAAKREAGEPPSRGARED